MPVQHPALLVQTIGFSVSRGSDVYSGLLQGAFHEAISEQQILRGLSLLSNAENVRQLGTEDLRLELSICRGFHEAMVWCPGLGNCYRS